MNATPLLFVSICLLMNGHIICVRPTQFFFYFLLSENLINNLLFVIPGQGTVGLCHGLFMAHEICEESFIDLLDVAHVVHDAVREIMS